MAKKKPVVEDDDQEPVEALELEEVEEVVVDPTKHIIVDGAVVEAPLDSTGQPELRERRLLFQGRNVEHTHEEQGVWAYTTK